ncbi:MAG TPA: acetate--CoA ligase family protein [Thermoanaerobaculia bacterium]|nr:acetate--CoA ligase family protein [Thermoanaerobaculia bacterium]
MSDSLQALFRPNRLAVIGASAKPGKLGFTIFKNVLDAGFGGPVIPVNPRGETILGVPSVKSVEEIPAGTDLAVVIIPAAAVPGAILQLGERKVKAAIVITGGFAESGDEGARLQEEVKRNAARCGIRVVGPNCQGVNYPHHGLCASWPLITRKGAMAIASQSGTVGAALADWAEQEKLGFSAFVSMGNRIDVDEADLIEFFGADPSTKVITLYIEGVKDPEKFLAAVRKCVKPIVIFKAGRTEQGRKAAESHTRSLAGKDEIYDAVFRQLGIHRAASLEELYDFSKALAYVPAPAGPRMLIVTSSGGSAIIATDVAADNGFRISPLPDALASQLRGVLPSHFIVGNPLDLTGDGNADLFRQVIATARDHYDMVMTIFGDPIPGASGALEPGNRDLVAYLGGADVERAETLLFHEKGIAVFPTPDRAVKALSCHVRFARDRFRPAAKAPAPATAAAPSGKSLSPADSIAFLSREGIPVVPSRRAGTEEEAVAAAGEIGYPVAVKMNSPDVTHKSDVGGVILNVRDEADVRKAFRELAGIVQRLGAREGGVLVSAMAAPGHEIIVGVTRDLQFGHAVMFGMGGTLVEILHDVSFRIVPFPERDAAEMIDETRGAKLLEGVRGSRPGDVAALRRLLVQISDVVEKNREIDEMDLNPVIVHEKGLTVVDARVVLSHPSLPEK